MVRQKETGEIKLVYSNNGKDRKCSNTKAYKDVAIAMLRELRKTEKGKKQLKQIAAILQTWEIDEELLRR